MSELVILCAAAALGRLGPEAAITAWATFFAVLLVLSLIIGALDTFTHRIALRRPWRAR